MGFCSLSCFLFDVDVLCRIKLHAAPLDERQGLHADRRSESIPGRLVCGRPLCVSVGTDSRVQFWPRGPRWFAGALETAVAAATLWSDFRPCSQSKDIQMVP